MTPQETLHDFYQELSNNNHHETANYILRLKRGGLVIVDKDTKKETNLFIQSN